MSPSAIVRSQARKTLKGNYVAAVASFLILLSPIYLLQGLTAVVDTLLMQAVDDTQTLMLLEIIVLTPLSILTVVLTSPLFNGFIRLYYRAAYTKQFNMNELFFYFQSDKYQKALHLNLMFVIRMIIPCVLCFLPVFVYHFVCFQYLSDFVGTVLYKDFAFIMTIMSSTLLILYALKYYLVFTLFCDNDSTEVHEIFRASKSMMAAQKPDAARLIFSFIPWMLLCLLILPALYVVPYMTTSLCIGAKWMTMKGK